MIGYTYGGSGQNFNLPNFADGKFMRGIGGNAAALGTAQQDAIRNITGEINTSSEAYEYNNPSFFENGNYLAKGVFSKIARENSRRPTLNANGKSETWVFDASRVVPTANENRPLNMAVVVIIKVKNVNTPIAGQIDKTILATETKAGITKLKNAITAKQEDAAVTEKAVSDLMEVNKGIGIDQSWQDVTAQRQSGVVYTNTTNQPIMVAVISQAPNPSSYITLAVEVNGKKINENNTNSAGGAYPTIVSFSVVVPKKGTYKITSSTTPRSWMELR